MTMRALLAFIPIAALLTVTAIVVAFDLIRCSTLAWLVTRARLRRGSLDGARGAADGRRLGVRLALERC